MKRKLYIFLGLAATSLWSIASASPTTYTYTFGDGTQSTTPGTVQSGGGGIVFGSTSETFDPTSITGTGGGTPTVTITAEGAPSGLNTGSLPTGVGGQPDDGQASSFGALSPSSNTPTGLFEVTNGDGGNTATGIAPYVSNQASGSAGHQNLTGENGITEQSVLLVNLNSFAAGSTLTFVMETGSNAAAYTGINLWEGTSATTPTGFGPTTSLKEVTADFGYLINGKNGGEMTATVTVPGTLGTDSWIAIQADCHYLLLDQLNITTPSGVPEPSFYGFFALAMVGLVFGARKMRARAAVAADEKA